ncbi:MAG: glycogen/starch synthase, partial [Candidatus Omnitrophota bacterium]|nr:glycogen/starch synthase [Candidatus Omnitrophota bacterium]
VLPAMADIGFYPDIIQACDWETALLPLYRKINFDKQRHFKKCRFLFSIHNLAYQGSFRPRAAEKIGIGAKFLRTLKSGGRVNFMKAGILYSDAINTVSKKYAREILTKEYGCGLDKVLKRRKKDLYGILNGVDYSNWNPETDKLIPVNYNSRALEDKLTCKSELLKKMGMTLPLSSPLLGFVGRLAEQKGIDLMIDAIDGIIKMGAGFILLGAGMEKYEKTLKNLAKEKAGKIGISIAFNDRLAHMIEAGVDIFLMPSRYEPCGLNQMYSLKYGTIPVVRTTGGLDDTITDYSKYPDRGNGFKFEKVRTKEFLGTIKRAINIFNNKKEWLKLQKRAMGYDFSWLSAAGEYAALYEKMTGKRGNR